MDIRSLRKMLGATQNGFATRYGIPLRTIQNWETGKRKPPQYIMEWLERQVCEDLVNRKTIQLPVYEKHKMDLLKRNQTVGAIAWLHEVQKVLGTNIVFALDEALMCQGNFGGRSDEYLVWVYGDDNLTRFNGVVVLGNQISQYHVIEKNGLRFTDLNRTIMDALANEDILDMQGITEAVSHYYFAHDESFSGIFVTPQYQKRFEMLAKEHGFSPNHFRKIFRETTGLSPVKFLNRLRITRACEYMKRDGRTAREAAEEVGFIDMNYFSRTFKQFIGCSPGRF